MSQQNDKNNIGSVISTMQRAILEQMQRGYREDQAIAMAVNKAKDVKDATYKR